MNRRRMPETRQAITHRFEIGGHVGYVTVGLFEDGTPGEMFIAMAKEGSTMSGWADAFATVFSYALQYGVPLDDLIAKLAYSSFEPSGFTKNPDVRFAKSVVDYVMRWMQARFSKKGEADAGQPVDAAGVSPVVPDNSVLGEQDLAGGQAPTPPVDWDEEKAKWAKIAAKMAKEKQKEEEFAPVRPTWGEAAIPSRCLGCRHYNPLANMTMKCLGAMDCPVKGPVELAQEKPSGGKTFQNSTDAPMCKQCGSQTVRSGSCYLCHVCGSTSGCS